MANKTKCPECLGCMIQLYRGTELYWHCSFCRSYYKALAGGKLQLIDRKEVFK